MIQDRLPKFVAHKARVAAKQRMLREIDVSSMSSRWSRSLAVEGPVFQHHGIFNPMCQISVSQICGLTGSESFLLRRFLFFHFAASWLCRRVHSSEWKKLVRSLRTRRA